MDESRAPSYAAAYAEPACWSPLSEGSAVSRHSRLLRRTKSDVVTSPEFLLARDVRVVSMRLHVPSAPLRALWAANHVHCTSAPTLVALWSLKRPQNGPHDRTGAATGAGLGNPMPAGETAAPMHPDWRRACAIGVLACLFVCLLA